MYFADFSGSSVQCADAFDVRDNREKSFGAPEAKISARPPKFTPLPKRFFSQYNPKETKSQAQNILNKLGMTLSGAIVLYLKQIAFHSGIPFEVKIPNELTMQTIEKSERGEELHEASSVDEMFKELDS